VADLTKKYRDDPTAMLDHLCSGSLEAKAVISRASEHSGFGPWIGFKVADMIDALDIARVEQNDLSVFLYDTPRQSILENLPNLPIDADGSEERQLERAMLWLRDQLKDCRLPHRPSSAPDFFSIETVWCKHRSHRHGHYPIGHDIDEINHGLEAFSMRRCSPSSW
jgi:hypothetical protein